MKDFDLRMRSAVWLSGPNLAAAEIAAMIGYRAVVLDIEHGTFDLAALERFIPALKGLELKVFAKVLGPSREPIQQALDFGADAIVIPHIEGAAHAEKICAFAKFPPVGARSFAGGRTAGYGGFDDEWLKRQDCETLCFAMIEDAQALAEVREILALPSVDGVFIGPSDLSLRRSRGSYKRIEGDWQDLKAIAEAAHEANKPWILPAWSVEEKAFAIKNGAYKMVLTMEHGALALGLRTAWEQTVQLFEEAAGADDK
ncbi:4-hydroxy-2-oxovalerate aldolase (plasmid) [Paraburkholderia caffeinilytica]|uniref:2-keto-3-deoxy-L-rhamnonate aldolase n=2 Tax=Paraburkholderia TaxID=1822464 RepID=A0A6J5FKD5_9BURK|nr:MULTISPECIES: aldolase/citrate lyase family protein [Paraburkholderia]AXL53991.1 4-hydroxy-2-oxovalerate aldolase [Paraburkholderia caffeinilytica]GGC65750.1 4-hydroxy-2-oxovalerate aldolase [Paraburkholderia caffeinilytica]CAB3781709.1 2-keto-3-deoxy-L-rhamnonate aldolase [Paraburkholderia caffeinitolerans]CAB3802053.1 2-keto-3-deoxy-L-rhamnonate aldolase [Paraburkholderia caffeinilytica]